MSLRTLPLLALLLAAPAAAQQKIAAGGPPAEAPYSLTAADGTGLKLVALDARAVVDGPLAFTELHLAFENPQPRVIEGHFKVTMPDGAAISRFAMKIRGAWMEGEVVEKQAARRAYEDALHRRQDPALLEQDAGNTFRARVFPIPARGRKEIIVSWSHSLMTAGESYRLPLRGLPEVESLKLTAMTSSDSGKSVRSSLGGTQSRYQISAVEKRRFTPDQDWIVYGGDLPAGGEALRSENLAVARFAVRAGAEPERLPGAVILFDSSASRAIDYARRLDALAAFVGRLPEIGVERIEVVAFDQTAAPVYLGSPGDFAKNGLRKLRARGALGASDLGAALAWVGSAAEKGVGRVIVFTDGVVTAGPRDAQKLAERAAALSARGVSRLDVVVDTTARDPQVLSALVTARLPPPGKVVEGKAPLDQQLRQLGRRTLPDTKIHVAGARWVWPNTLRGAQDGDTVVVFADLPAASPFVVELSGGLSARLEPPARTAERPLIERTWVAARIDRLLDMQTHGDVDLKEGLTHQVIALSTRHRVLSPYTALVVLETEADYRRFNIDRRALADILTIGPTGLEVVQRGGAAVAAVPPPPPPPPRQAVRGRVAPNKAAEAPASVTTPDHWFGGEDDEAPEGDMAEAVAAAPAPDAPVEAAKRDMAPRARPKPVARSRSAAPRAPMAEANATGRARDVEDRTVARASGAKKTRGPRGRRRSAHRTPDPFPSRRPPPPPPTRIARRPHKAIARSQGRREYDEIARQGTSALTGRLATIAKNLHRKRVKKAVGEAEAWRAKDPTDLLALIGLGRAYRAAGNTRDALRAFGSVLDLYPSRADMRRFAGNYLESLGAAGLPLAADTYTVAAEQRPDHPSVHHQLAMVLVRLGRYGEALDAALMGLRARRVQGRFAGADRILQEDAQLIAAAWAAAEPARREEIRKRLEPFGLRIDEAESLRFVLTWETDANDVDFHIFDKRYDHAYYSRRGLASGGELYADITTGYGPECFTIYAPKAWPYRLRAHYYSRGPMGYGMGKVQVIRHDGHGHLGFEDRPFVIMNDSAYVDLGVVKTGTARPARKPPRAIAK